MPKSKRKKSNTRQFAFLGIFTALLFGLGALPSIPKKYAHRLLPTLFGNQATYSDIQVDPFKGTATFTNLKVKSGDGPMLETARATFTFERLAGLRKTMEISRIDLKEPTIVLHRSPTGTINLNLLPSQDTAQTMRIGEIHAHRANVFYLDEVSSQTAWEAMATNVTAHAYHIKLSSQFPYDNTIDELQLEMPQILVSRFGNELRRGYKNHRLSIGLTTISTDFFTYEDQQDPNVPFEISLSELQGNIKQLHLGKPHVPEIDAADYAWTARWIQPEEPAYFGLFGKLGPVTGRETLLRGNLYAIGLDLQTLEPTFLSQQLDPRTVHAAVGGKRLDLHLAFKGQSKEMGMTAKTESERGLLTESFIVFGDLDKTSANAWQQLGKALHAPDKAVAPAEIQAQDPRAVKAAWNRDTKIRAAALFKKAEIR